MEGNAPRLIVTCFNFPGRLRMYFKRKTRASCQGCSKLAQNLSRIIIMWVGSDERGKKNPRILLNGNRDMATRKKNRLFVKNFSFTLASWVSSLWTPHHDVVYVVNNDLITCQVISAFVVLVTRGRLTSSHNLLNVGWYHARKLPQFAEKTPPLSSLWGRRKCLFIFWLRHFQPVKSHAWYRQLRNVMNQRDHWNVMLELEARLEFFEFGVELLCALAGWWRDWIKWAKGN